MNGSSPQNVNIDEAPVGNPQQNPDKKKLLLLITSAVVLAALTLGGVLLWQQSLQQAGLRPSSPTPAVSPSPELSPSPSPTPSPQLQGQSEIDTSNWQTYRNEEFGFQFEYPPSLTIAGESIEEVGVVAFDHDTFIIWIDVFSDAKSTSFLTHGFEESFREGKDVTEITRDEFTVDEKTVHKVSGDLIIPAAEEVSYMEMLYISIESLDETLVLVGIAQKEFSEELSQLHNQILSTFRFTP